MRLCFEQLCFMWLCFMWLCFMWHCFMQLCICTLVSFEVKSDAKTNVNFEVNFLSFGQEKSFRYNRKLPEVTLPGIEPGPSP